MQRGEPVPDILPVDLGDLPSGAWSIFGAAVNNQSFTGRMPGKVEIDDIISELLQAYEPLSEPVL